MRSANLLHLRFSIAALLPTCAYFLCCVLLILFIYINHFDYVTAEWASEPWAASSAVCVRLFFLFLRFDGRGPFCKSAGGARNSASVIRSSVRKCHNCIEFLFAYASLYLLLLNRMRDLIDYLFVLAFFYPGAASFACWALASLFFRTRCVRATPSAESVLLLLLQRRRHAVPKLSVAAGLALTCMGFLWQRATASFSFQQTGF